MPLIVPYDFHPHGHLGVDDDGDGDDEDDDDDDDYDDDEEHGANSRVASAAVAVTLRLTRAADCGNGGDCYMATAPTSLMRVTLFLKTLSSCPEHAERFRV